MEGTNSEGGRRPCNIRLILTPSPGSSLPLGRERLMQRCQGVPPRWRDGGRGVINGRENGRGIDRMLSGRV